jgi:methionyl-tRNA synthetase
MEMVGLAPTGSGNLNIGASLVGRTVKMIEKMPGKIAKKPLVKGTVDLSRKIYNAPAQSLSNVASRLEDNGFESLGKALRESVESGNTYKKNAALFTIMQNPNARVLIDEGDLQDQENATDKTREP